MLRNVSLPKSSYSTNSSLVFISSRSSAFCIMSKSVAFPSTREGIVYPVASIVPHWSMKSAAIIWINSDAFLFSYTYVSLFFRYRSWSYAVIDISPDLERFCANIHPQNTPVPSTTSCTGSPSVNSMPSDSMLNLRLDGVPLRSVVHEMPSSAGGEYITLSCVINICASMLHRLMLSGW